MNTDTQETQNIVLIDPKALDAPVFNSRASYDEDEIKSLADSIVQTGQRQPIEVHQHPDDESRYVIHFGSRRAAACALAGLPVKAVIVGAPESEAEAAFINAAENAQRADLTTFDLARTFAHLREQGQGVQDIADRLGFTKGYVSELTKQYVKLADPIKEAWERAATIEKERDPGKLSARQQAELKCVSGKFLRELVDEKEPKQVELFEAAIAELMKEDEAEEEGDDDKPKKKKGKATAKETMYKVSATRYAEVNDAIGKLGKGGGFSADDVKLIRNFVKYLVSDLDKVKGHLGEDKPAAKKEEK